MISFFSRPLRLVALVAVIGVAGGAFWLWSGAARQHGRRPEHRARAARGPSPPPRPGPACRLRRLPLPRDRLRERRQRRALRLAAPPPPRPSTSSAPRGRLPRGPPPLRGARRGGRVRRGQRGTSATWRRTKVMFLGIGTDDRDDVQPPSFDHPSKLTVGKTWAGSYRLGELKVDLHRQGHRQGHRAQLDGKPCPSS